MKRVVAIMLAMVCTHVYGAEPVSFSGGYSWEDGKGWAAMSSGLPDGVHGKDVSPDKIRLEHINLVLEIYEKNLRQGTVKGSGLTMDTLYLFSFVGDERFSSLIYDQYAERLFEEFGDQEGATLLLYYKTGGNLEKLRSLYQQPVNDDVKKAIEACFFDASVGLLEEAERDVANATPQSLSVTMWTQYRTRKYYTYDREGEPELTDLFGGPVAGSEDDWTLHECATDERDLYIKYENTTENRLIRIEIPRRKNGNCWCGLKMMRTDGVPVLASGYLVTHEHEKQWITLYPGDQYIQKMDVNFSVTFPLVLMAQLFSDFGGYVVRLGDYWVGNAGDEFQVTLNYTCNYLIARSVEELDQMKDVEWKSARAGPLSLDYEPQNPVDSKRATMRIQQEKAWNRIMKHWTDVP
ncbi:hypothetical protein P4C99_10145 [Pontiellaceae bacterium B1224]|nr:hypothetical protein [Pontiellaceae bacterium B1224]